MRERQYHKESDSLLQNDSMQYMGGEEDMEVKEGDDAGDAKPREGPTDEEAKQTAIERQAEFNKILEKRRADSGPIDHEESPMVAALKYMLCKNFWVSFVLCTLIIALGQLSKGGDDCGIDPISWVQTYFAIIFFKAIVEILCYFFLLCSCNGGCIIAVYITGNVFALISLVVWIIIGYTIYFSEKNQCQDSPDQFGWLVFMVILIFFGFFMVIGLFFLLCMLCCLGGAMAAGGSGTEGSQGTQTNGIQGATKQVFNPDMFNVKEKCNICFEDFKTDDKTITLKCSEKHFFHDKCIQDYVDKQDENTKLLLRCPDCNDTSELVLE